VATARSISSSVVNRESETRIVARASSPVSPIAVSTWLGSIRPDEQAAMGLTESEARATIRVSLSRFTTEEEVDRAVATLAEIVPRARVAISD